MPPKEHPSLRLEALSLEHLPGVMSWVNDREVMQYFANRQTPISEDEERAYLVKLLGSSTDRAFSIFDGARYLGQCSLNQIYWPARNARLFIALRSDCQGEGYGPAALKALLALAWGTIDLHKVWLIVREDNRSAQAMYLKLGFSFEGVLRDEYFVLGRYHDMVRMAIVRPLGA
ncbi:MAG: GNAT family N-acetyltransferase [Deltaproteobacteria bacterium]|nr:GNAT family N-acetyltransferase [Deltaproteobacteria bacterium]